MYDGFFEVFVGLLAIVLGFFRKNRTMPGSSILRRYNKQILFISGVLMIAIGTCKFINKG